MYTHTHTQITAVLLLITRDAAASILRYKHTNVGEYTVESSVWEADSAAGYDGKHPALPSTPHRSSLSLWRF